MVQYFFSGDTGFEWTLIFRVDKDLFLALPNNNTILYYAEG